MADRSYSDEEVEAILRRALERQQESADGLGHTELVAAAREIGLDDASIDRAVAELEREKATRSVVLDAKRRKRAGFLRHLFTYLAIVGCMIGLNVVGLAGAWVWWVVFGWGAGVLLSLPRAFREPDEQEIEQAEHRRNRRERRRLAAEERHAAREAARERARRRAAGIKSPIESELESVVEEGVALLLRAAASKLREASEGAAARTAAQGEFGRYVAKKQGATPAPAAPAPKVRVAETESAPQAEEAVARPTPADRARAGK